MAAYHKVIGIDLGTTFSAVSAFHFEKQDVVIIPNRQNEPTTPSVVYISSSGHVSVGRTARQKLIRDPDGVVIEAKRAMGELGDGGGRSKLQAAGRTFDPELISAYILKELKVCAEKLIGEPIFDAVITVPAYFKETQKNATKEAAKIAKLNPRLIINEPTAAAVAYGLESGEKQTFVVYDFGGGTFDVSVVHIDDDQTIEILGTGGNAHMGGGDIDQLLVDWALQKMRDQFGRDFGAEAKLLGRLRLAAEQLKIDLCNEGTGQELYLEHPTTGVDEIAYEITSEQFEGMVRPLLDRTVEQVNRALESAREQHEIGLEDIDSFILVGGSSRIPLVEKVLTDAFHKPIRSDLNPAEIVAMGAARMALNYEPSLAAEIRDDAELRLDATATPEDQITDTNIKDVVSHTLGIGLKDDVYDPLIPRDHTIPARVVRGGYSPAEDNQPNIWVPVFQGDAKVASQNFKLGQVTIEIENPGPRGSHNFQVTFALDVDGIFTGEILHEQTSKVTPILLDRGQDALTEKRRVELAEVVEAGIVGPAEGGAPADAAGGGGASTVPPGSPPAEGADPVTALIVQATAAMPNLPADRQRELTEALLRLNQARAADDTRGQGMAVAEITMILVR